MKCDILIIGCGPAGSSCAIQAAKYGNDVIIVDKRLSIGEPVECAEFIPKLLYHELEISKKCVVQEISKMKVFTLKGLVKEFNSPGYMINRSTFDKELALKAVNEGAKLLVNTRCIGKDANHLIFKQGHNDLTISAQIVVGADGPMSIVGSWIHKKQEDFVLGMQVEVPLVKPLDSIEIHFWDEFFGGYGWFFPKGDVANVGCGVMHGCLQPQMIRQHLNHFCDYLSDQGKIINNPLSIRFGLIPCSGPFEEAVHQNMIVVGDAAGQTHPITGGGIAPAIVCGKIAGKVANDAIDENNLDLLKNYDVQYRKIYGKEMARAVNKRDWMIKNWDTLTDNIPYIWPTFMEYYD